MAFLGDTALARHACQASGCVCQNFMVFGSCLAPGSSSRLRSKVPKIVLSRRNATDAKLNMEYWPGLGPSVSISVQTYVSDMSVSQLSCVSLHPARYRGFRAGASQTGSRSNKRVQA